MAIYIPWFDSQSAYTIAELSGTFTPNHNFVLFFSSFGTPLQLVHAITERARINKNESEEKILEDLIIMLQNSKVHTFFKAIKDCQIVLSIFSLAFKLYSSNFSLFS